MSVKHMPLANDLVLMLEGCLDMGIKKAKSRCILVLILCGSLSACTHATSTTPDNVPVPEANQTILDSVPPLEPAPLPPKHLALAIQPRRAASQAPLAAAAGADKLQLELDELRRDHKRLLNELEALKQADKGRQAGLGQHRKDLIQISLPSLPATPKPKAKVDKPDKPLGEIVIIRSSLHLRRTFADRHSWFYELTGTAINRSGVVLNGGSLTYQDIDNRHTVLGEGYAKLPEKWQPNARCSFTTHLEVPAWRKPQLHLADVEGLYDEWYTVGGREIEHE